MGVSKIALLGNPNCGKSSIFNQLTGLNQHIGNYPGVTVDKKEGFFHLINGDKIKVVDLPGTYSLHPKTEDEKVVANYLTNIESEDYPDVVIVVVDASNLERNLLLFTQAYDLKIPVILMVNMIDVATNNGISIDQEKLCQELGGVPVIFSNARTGQGLDELKVILEDFSPIKDHKPFYSSFEFVEKKEHELVKETKIRYAKISKLVQSVSNQENTKSKSKLLTNTLDKYFTHPIYSYLVFLLILFGIFQAVYLIPEYPMTLIDESFAWVQEFTIKLFPEGPFTDLIANGIIPGIGGVVIFIPQIALLFLFIAILEESGYMARIVFIMDRLLRPLGLNGRSIVPMISSFACAIPGIMATRTIQNKKERLITILIAPLMSCAARLPVYAILIAVVIPDKEVFGIMNLKGLVLLALYLLGIVMSIIIAAVINLFYKSPQKGFFILEMPKYKMPRWKNIGLIILEKSKVFVFSAGKIILAISIILWFLASYGPDKTPLMESDASENTSIQKDFTIEDSYIGIFGKTIEPTIKPLGYDWKIGIALITSFAAREVFVGTMATIYNVEDDGEENLGLVDKMKNATISPGVPQFSLASGLSLMVFYVFAMQCMSTLAIVHRETKSWKIPIIQFVYMTSLAYITALITFNIFN